MSTFLPIHSMFYSPPRLLGGHKVAGMKSGLSLAVQLNRLVSFLTPTHCPVGIMCEFSHISLMFLNRSLFNKPRDNNDQQNVSTAYTPKSQTETVTGSLKMERILSRQQARRASFLRVSLLVHRHGRFVHSLEITL